MKKINYIEAEEITKNTQGSVATNQLDTKELQIPCFNGIPSKM